MGLKIIGAVAALFLASMSAAPATTFVVTFDNVLIDNNPDYTITGSFLYDNTLQLNPNAVSDFNVNVVSPYGTSQMNYVWSVDGNFDYLGLGITNSATTPALILVFSLSGGANGTGLNNLDLAIANNVPLPILPLGSGSNFIPGGSAAVSSVADLYSVYDQYLFHNGPPPDAVFSSISGSLVASAVPELSTWAMMTLGFLGLGLIMRRRLSNLAS
jgi:hypothetical protein